MPRIRSHKYNNTYVVIIYSNNCLVSALFSVSLNLREFIHPISIHARKEEVWARKLWFKKKCHKSFVMKYSFEEKNIFEPPTSTFQVVIILFKFYFRVKISFLTNLQFQQHFIFILFFSHVVITKHPNFITK